MTSLFRAIKQRSFPNISLDDLITQFKYAGNNYSTLLNQSIPSDHEEVEQSFEGYVSGLYKGNGVVFACMGARLRLFQQARFIFRSLGNRAASSPRGDVALEGLELRDEQWTERGRPGRLFGTKDLRLLENPWPNGNTHDLLARAIQDADLSGNAFFAKRGAGANLRLKRLRPDWMAIVLGSPDKKTRLDSSDIDAEVIGYIYQPGGTGSQKEPVTLLVDEVVHFAPYPDPIASFRGMSWLTPVIREITADSAATSHKLKFFENGATANMIVTLDSGIHPDQFDRWVDAFEKQHTGYLNAYKTLYFGGGADAKVVGADMHQMDFKTVQGAGETRIAAAAGVPPIVVGLSEGLAAATYSNYGQARRSMADLMAHPAWQNAAGSFEKIVNVPGGSELWYDARDIPFLQEDQKDAAEIQNRKATTIQVLVNSGYTPDSVIAAVDADDMTLLEHTGLYSVQLQPPLPNGPAAPVADQAGRALKAWLDTLKTDAV